MAEKPKTDIQKVAEELAATLNNVIKNAKQGESEFKLASKPFTTDIKKSEHKYRDYVSQPKPIENAKKELVGFKTGTFIDDLFLDENGESLGIPIVCQLGIVGNPEVGKSILAQEIALKCASEGKRVIFVTSEDAWETSSQRNDLQSRFRQKAEIMGLDWEKVRDNLVVLDTISHSELRDFNTFIGTYRYLIENIGADLLIIDSITLLESYRGALKYRIMSLSRYNQSKGVTAIYVSQRDSEDSADKLGYAGGIGIGHNLDGTICIDFKKATSELKEDLNRNRPSDNKIKQWDLVEFVRNLGCRLCSIDRKYYEVEITKDGFLRLAVWEN